MSELSDWDFEAIRRHESMILENQIVLKDFMARYENDRSACSERYQQDRNEARVWREEMSKKVDDINKFLIEMKPNYRAFLVFVGIVIMGSLALIFKMIWAKVQTG